MDRCPLSRHQLVSWVNEEFKVSISKVEQCGTGAVFCLIFDSVIGNVRMSRVNWGARQEYEYIDNFRLLQCALTDAGVQKKLDIDTLVRCRCQNNLELLQWAYNFYERSGGMPDVYDPVHTREMGTCRGPWPLHFRTWGQKSRGENLPPSRRDKKPKEDDIASTFKDERDYYYGVLRQVEVFCQENIAEGRTLVEAQAVLGLLYEEGEQ
ncbi:MAG: hypothetical protein KVP17_004463 [Porospora cf. gigantea B]|uniref:uncharacterized protein n=1 Tax=Porospora cf. gigantea B TaxID=2853592 RepID=UPI003571915A|nr:MAG: hypothetical protein KVP17_004463 [Porospora cf. gigantea B]